MPEFKFEVQVSATVGAVTSSEEGARKMLHDAKAARSAVLRLEKPTNSEALALFGRSAE